MDLYLLMSSAASLALDRVLLGSKLGSSAL